MVKCNCGEVFPTGCLHANHKVRIYNEGGDVTEHKPVCSMCKANIDFDDIDSYVVAEDNDGNIMDVFCLPCGCIRVEEMVTEITKGNYLIGGSATR